MAVTDLLKEFEALKAEVVVLKAKLTTLEGLTRGIRSALGEIQPRLLVASRFVGALKTSGYNADRLRLLTEELKGNVPAPYLERG
ncbi:hypothetical protein ES703_04164 [subsurface metagenome]|nr:hypothetical protein [bacterium]